VVPVTNGSTGNLGITFIAMVFLAVFYVLTLFVVPLIVLGNGSLVNSVMESASLFRKMWSSFLPIFLRSTALYDK
jgi:hypothetical protein